MVRLQYLYEMGPCPVCGDTGKGQGGFDCGLCNGGKNKPQTQPAADPVVQQPAAITNERENDKGGRGAVSGEDEGD